MDEALPVACSLAPRDLDDRRRRWLRLSARALIEKTPIAAGMRLRFRARDGVESELRELAARERECCSFAAWRVAPAGPGEVALEVTAAGAGVAAVRALFEEPAPAPLERG